MLNQQTINKLHELKLTGMAEAFSDQTKQPDMDRLSFAERFGLIVDRQWTWKENKRMERYLKNARMKLDACVEDIDYKTPRGIDQSVMMSLISCDWVRRHRNIIITGPTGAGKTFLACALTNKACRAIFLSAGSSMGHARGLAHKGLQQSAQGKRGRRPFAEPVRIAWPNRGYGAAPVL